MQPVPLILAVSLLTGCALGGFLLGRRHRLSAAQRRLADHLRAAQPRLLLVGCPPEAPDHWVPATLCHRYTFTLVDGQLLSLHELTSFLIATPEGLILDSQAPCAALPPGFHNAPSTAPPAPPLPVRVEVPSLAD